MFLISDILQRCPEKTVHNKEINGYHHRYLFLRKRFSDKRSAKSVIVVDAGFY